MIRKQMSFFYNFIGSFLRNFALAITPQKQYNNHEKYAKETIWVQLVSVAVDELHDHTFFNTNQPS